MYQSDMWTVGPGVGAHSFFAERGAEAPGPGLRPAERLYTALWAREKGGGIQRLSPALAA